MRILLIEDDPQTATYLLKGLSESGYSVNHANEGEHGLNLALNKPYDVLIIDRMLPKLDGLSLIRLLREAGKQTPILVLSALGEVDDRVEGLRAGGDDYLVKPYAFSELLARLEALGRRHIEIKNIRYLQVADLILNPFNHKVTRAGHVLRLQPMELRLLEFLMHHTGQIMTRTMLLEQVWDLHFDPQTNIIDTQISRLRSKIDKGFNKPLLHTLRGIGYKLDELP